MKSRHALIEKIKIRRGLYLYKVGASPYWQCSIWVPAKRGYISRSTEEASRIEARRAAEELCLSVLERHAVPVVPKDRTFDCFADKLIAKQHELAARNVRSLRLAKGDECIINNKINGLLKFFGGRDIRHIRTKDVNAYLEFVKESRAEPFAFSTYSNRISCLRKVLKIARDVGVIGTIPDTPRPPKKDNPRPFFRFEPLVSKENDEYKRILSTAKQMAQERVRVRWLPVTDELYDIILFLMHTFLRPTVSELYSLRHRDVTIAENPKRLLLSIKKGKTGHRVTNTLEAAVSVYKRCRERNPQAKPDDYVFLPHYLNRETARNVISRQFGVLLKRANLERTDHAVPHSMYSIRHTALCMRLVKSKGRVNLFILKQAAGTSIDQLERFYLKNLPPSAELARNLQTLGED